MRIILLVAAVLFTTGIADVANACQYPTPQPFEKALASATSVFVFRLDEAQYKREDFGSGAHTSWVEGRISLIQNLYGNPVGLKKIEYDSGWCGGVNMIVGHHYLIATNASGDIIQLEPADESLYDIEGFYDPSEKKRSLRSFLVRPVIQAIYANRPLPARFPPEEIAGRTTVQAPPPPVSAD